MRDEATAAVDLSESVGENALARPSGSGLSHKAAVRRMAAYLRNSIGCTIVIAELATANQETPDVLGFQSGARSTLIEVKVSRADFLADKHKSFRRQMERGMGERRYYAAPKGLISPDELPEGWGLLEIEDRCVREKKEAERQEPNRRAEIIMLTSVMRRLELSTAVFVRQDERRP